MDNAKRQVAGLLQAADRERRRLHNSACLGEKTLRSLCPFLIFSIYIDPGTNHQVSLWKLIRTANQ